MDQKEKRLLETELTKMGLAGLQMNGDPSAELVQQIAAIVNAWRPAENKFGEWVDQHKYLRDLLNECEPADRGAMYEAIKPYLKFKAHSLQTYEDMIAERAGKLVSQRRMRVTGDAPKPLEIGGARYAVVPKPQAAKVVATLTCHKCRKVERFLHDTPAGAMIEGRKAGWTRDKALGKETCPECSAVGAHDEVVALSRSEQLFVKDQRRVN